jgi:hypothetical protein
MKIIQWFIPKSNGNVIVLALVLLQLGFYYIEIHKEPVNIYGISVYAVLIIALPAYIHAKQCAWVTVFLFSIYTLHQAIFLFYDWYYTDSFSVFPILLMLSQSITSLLCLAVLSLGASRHSIEPNKLLRIPLAVAVTEH